MEQMRGIGPPYQPWQGCVLPLNYICKWRSRWDLNPRSPPWQGGMLTTTPLDQLLGYYIITDTKIKYKFHFFLGVFSNRKMRFSTSFFYKIDGGEGGIWTLATLNTPYSLSRGAPSASWVLLHDRYAMKFAIKNGGERGIRTPGTLRYHWFSRPAP